MKLTRIGVSHYRSIGEQPVMIDLTKKINVLVGANNCGKSNVLRALHLLDDTRDGSPSAMAELDCHKRVTESVFGFRLETEFTNETPDVLRSVPSLWFDCKLERQGGIPNHVVSSMFGPLDWDHYRPMRDKLNGDYYSGRPNPETIRNDKIATASRLARQLQNTLPHVVTIPQFREIKPAEKYTVSGGGIVRLLASWHHPKIGHDEDRVKFNSVENLLRELLSIRDVTLEVSSEEPVIIVSRGGLRLPLDSYGTGIHELIILAIAVRSKENSILCIEEPEIHLHPLLQRRFIEFLRKETSNRYVITTHSPALIAPAVDIAVSHLWLEDGVTKSRLVETAGHSLEALRDLGAKASDLLQANSVIWIEGPSDRIYLNRWLELLFAGEFREGIDYSVMFYGGRLLAHLSLERESEEETDELIQLLRINQHSAIIIDSDRRKASTELNTTKQRVQRECASAGVLCWITDGREIENELPVEAINLAYAELSDTTPSVSLGRFASIEAALAKALHPQWKRATYYENVKPQMARKIAAHIRKEHLKPALVARLEAIAKVIRHQPIGG